MRSTPIVLLALFASVPVSVSARDGWQFSIGTGAALNLQESINIEMDNGEEIKSDSVQFETKPFTSPLYYNLRVSRWQQSQAWEMEYIHHKLYAKSSDLNSRVDNFEVTDGYNLVYLNYALVVAPNWNARFGMGPVIAHPDVTVDGQQSHGDYQLSGITSQLALEREFAVNPSLLLSLEGKVTYSYAQIDLDYGEVKVPNTALHLIAQLKFGL